LTTLPFDLLHISGQINLKELEPVADVAANLIGEFAELPSCFLGDEKLVLHVDWSVSAAPEKVQH